MRIAVFAIAATALLCSGRSAAADPVVILGKALSQKWAGVEIECPPGSICLNGWTRWDISVVKTIHGANVPRRIAAAHLQHLLYKKMSANLVQLFVLVPIESAEERARLRADYYISELSYPREMHCLSLMPSEVGLPIEDSDVVSDKAGEVHCFDLSKNADATG